MPEETTPDELPVKDAGILFSREHPPSERTVWRWISHGHRNRRSGKVVTLVPKYVGGRVYVTREAASAFMAATNPVQAKKKVEQNALARSKAARAALEKLGV